MTRRLWKSAFFAALSCTVACSDPGDSTTPDAGAPVVTPGCVVGTLECVCATSGGCALDSDGQPLQCVAGVCLRPSCPPGQPGCACVASTSSCLSGSSCVGGVCTRDNCEAGTVNCTCATGGSCDVGLFCKDATICVDRKGFPGGACLANDLCQPGNKCDRSQGVCLACDLGTQGCACTNQGVCNQGLSCVAGLCSSKADLPPASPSCFTPCRGDLTQGAETRTCDADGLMAGCIDAQQCVDGSCVAPGDRKPTCQSDVECPSFQTCLHGGCYSNCNVNLDCPAGQGCHRRVCRVPCSLNTGTVACPQGMTCDSDDGETGFCVAVQPAPANPAPAAPDAPTFSVKGGGTFDFTNLKQQADMKFSMTGTTSQRITIHKVSHTLLLADGRRETVDSPVDATTGLPRPCTGSASDCPLWWLDLSLGTQHVRGDHLDLTLPANCGDACPSIRLANAAGSPGVRYEGLLRVSGPGGNHDVLIRYASGLSGRWEGQVHYFTNFDSKGLQDWLDRTDRSDVSDVENGLIQRWGAFRRGNLDGWEEFEAVLTSVRTGSWQQPRVQQLCDGVTGGSPDAVCYPFSNPAGVRVFVQNQQSAPVPSATTEIPIALNLKARDDDPATFTGRIDSQTALHYPGNPAASLKLKASPTLPGSCDPAVRTACVVYIDAFQADVAVGGRYITPDGTCRPGYQAVSEPWLVPGFTDATRPGSGGLVRTECRDAQLPYTDPNFVPQNLDLARSNPVPDGLPRKRHLEVLDGALVNQTKLFALVRETFEGFLPGGGDVSAYAFMVLQRAPSEVTEEEFVGTPAANAPKSPPDLGVACSAALLAKLPSAVTSDRNVLVRTLINGSAAATASFAMDPLPAVSVPSQIHYLCDGHFDGGGKLTDVVSNPYGTSEPPPDSGYFKNPDGSGGYVFHLPNPCLPGSKVTFFDTGSQFSALDVLTDACQDDGSCEQTLATWEQSNLVLARDPTWKCLDPARALCDVDQTDLRKGKQFFRKRANAPQFSFQGLTPVVNSAFRYKTRFKSSLNESAQVGFAPSICAAGKAEYCYAPTEISDARDRVDCLVDIYTKQISTLDPTVRGELEVFLRGNFSATADNVDGFERLYAELLVMLGDEELTQAFASRFDVAGVSTRNFDGTLFEIDGINLSSVAGSEMQRLYASVQYYQLALDRLYRLGPNLGEALSRSDTSTRTNFVSPQTVTLYLARLVRASAQKALAWSEIAKHYRDFNKIDLAERVLKRAYARTYLESALFSQLMLEIADQTGYSFRAQIEKVLADSQGTYRSAMLDMREVFQDIVRGAVYFGFPAAYVPFPAIDGAGSLATNGFSVLFDVARQRQQAATDRELAAFESLTDGKLDSAQFQSELTQVRNNYEDQLASSCGTFVGTDGATYPAIKRYADRNPLAVMTGNPCAMFPNGTIYESMLEVDVASAALQGVLARYRNARAEIETERTRVAAQCGLIREQAEYEYASGEKVNQLTTDMANTQTAINAVARGLDVAKGAIDSYSNCLTATLPDGKISCGVLATVSGVLGGVGVVLQGGAEAAATRYQKKIAEKHLETGKWVTERQCDSQLIDSAARTAGMVRGLDEITLEALRAQAALELATAQVERGYGEASRLQERLEQARQSLVDVEAARSDPNTRIFRNDAIINADLAFDDAMRAAYRATRMYEYYTSTSYARLGDLFLIRLASRGRPNLQDYLTSLENAFQDFQEQFGLPDARIAVLSLRDDILKVPYFSDDGRTLTDEARTSRLQAMLKDPARLDTNGYVTIPFGTSVAELSPLTRNHKIRYIEANIVGSVIGDRLGRVYLRQRGTSVLRTVDERLDYYVFPERTAVINTFFNGSRVYAPEVYQNQRLRDRPYVHTMWELVINKRDELVNKDIDLGSLTDIQIFIHYSDFTVF